VAEPQDRPLLCAIPLYINGLQKAAGLVVEVAFVGAISGGGIILIQEDPSPRDDGREIFAEPEVPLRA
jgi:hypothetical protein